MNHYFTICIIFLLNSCNSLGQQECLFCGNWKWEKNDEKRDFTLQISKQDSIIQGKHCYVLDSGNKMDCALENNDFSFKSKITNSDSIVIKIKSYYSNEIGMVSLKYFNGRIFWKLLQAPKGEYYLPREAILLKDH